MVRRLSILTGLVLVMALSAQAAVAGKAHFVGTPTVTRTDTSITVSGKVAGLGNVTQIHVDVTGDARCVNPGQNKPKAANKQSFAAGGDFPVQNGKADFSVPASVSFQPPCSPPMTVEFSSVTVTVTADDGTFLQHRFSGTF